MPHAKDTDIPIAHLIASLIYEPDTGRLRWKHRLDRSPQWNARWADKVAGTINKGGYRHINLIVEGRVRGVYAHRIAHVLMTGKWPEDDVDHRDHNHDNNRWENLRPATNAENGQNHQKAKGVWWDKQTSKWRAGIRVNYRRHDLGRFDTREDAIQARLKAQAELHPFAGG